MELKQPESKGMRCDERHQMFTRPYFLILLRHSFILLLRLFLALFIFFDRGLSGSLDIFTCCLHEW